jgi:hypothetical protein
LLPLLYARATIKDITMAGWPAALPSPIYSTTLYFVNMKWQQNVTDSTLQLANSRELTAMSWSHARLAGNGSRCAIEAASGDERDAVMLAVLCALISEETNPSLTKPEPERTNGVSCTCVATATNTNRSTRWFG